MTNYTEQGVVFDSKGKRLVGIVSVPDVAATVGVLILVGGPQYRVGSHRQFTLLARSLAAQGIASFRFDYGGMGDSEGQKQEFHEVGADFTAALDAFLEAVPQLTGVVLWGLCDAAVTALMYSADEPRVKGMILLNPWVHLGDYSPEVKLSHYYGPLLMGRDTWRRFFTGKIAVGSTLKEFARDSGMLLKKTLVQSLGVPQRHSYAAAMLAGLESFNGGVLFVVGEQDLTGREFLSLANNDPAWKRAMARPQVAVHEIAGADHTFSRKHWQDELTALTLAWVTKNQSAD